MPRLIPSFRFVLALVATSVSSSFAFADESLQPVADFRHLAQPMLEQYCYDCHSGESADGGIALDEIQGADQFQKDRADWQKVLARVSNGSMPPEDYEAPTAEERTQLAEWINTRLNQLNCNTPQDPGWITLRRLNRDQYRNTIRDLLGVDFEPSKTFPPDVLAYGFDNNADVLTVNPVLLEKYLEAARDISRLAIPTPESVETGVERIPKDKWEGGQFDGEESRTLSTVGSVEFVYHFNQPGRYWLRAKVSASQAGDEPVKMSLMVDGQPVQTVEVYATQEESEQIAFAIDTEAGNLRLGVAFRNDFYDEATKGDRNLYVERFEVIGPLPVAFGELPSAYERWFAAEPSPTDWRDEHAWRTPVAQTLSDFMLAAFRRPAPADELNRLITLVDSRRQAGDSYQQAMQVALQVMLVSPRFLYIGNVDEAPRSDAQGEAGYEVDEYELAARLSYFLWSSTPDATLLRLASEGRLRAELPAEVARLLRDRRSEQFTTNFAGQWLGTRLLADLEPDESQFDGFDAELREAMTREANLVFADVVRQNLPLTTLIDANFTYLNQRLATHYGIAGIEGDQFRRVSLAELAPYPGVRGGVLTMAGVLASTSNPDRTSPVKRGKWVLSELLAEPPPAPPPGITSLEVVAERSKRPLSVREQMELHRAEPSCAVCHQKMDPLGLALENYDMVGRWRTEDNTGPINSAGELPSGDKIAGVADLRSLLAAQPDAFRRCLAEKLLTYGLGRGLEYYDECTLREICRRALDDGDKMQTLILAVIESPAFQQRRFVTAE
ncbi:DUF1592 domain-containing protein [Aeoliella mucimassa]|uniref:Planctomycete cytochrome C n=1 Tax=Aeoliella mucimassa TaxID=2527972 RepID=A0A518AKI7_9BACT|nr:DUF1592 domain-containing protein [Aeoliella mucimassa]QDU55241.1 hypothetical protein Pan181_14270 [Aeoliella mucimassa]